MDAPGGLAQRLYDITRGGGRVKASSLTPPADLEEAMAVQAELCALLDCERNRSGVVKPDK